MTTMMMMQLGVEARSDGAVVDAELGGVLRRALSPAPLHLGPDGDETQSDQLNDATDAVGRLLQLVRLRVLLRVLQALGAERAQQQRQEQVQHLHAHAHPPRRPDSSNPRNVTSGDLITYLRTLLGENKQMGSGLG